MVVPDVDDSASSMCDLNRRLFDLVVGMHCLAKHLSETIVLSVSMGLMACLFGHVLIMDFMMG